MTFSTILLKSVKSTLKKEEILRIGRPDLPTCQPTLERFLLSIAYTEKGYLFTMNVRQDIVVLHNIVDLPST